MTTDDTLRYKNQSIFHAIGFLLVIAVNITAIQLPINGRTTADISDKYAHLLVPARPALAIWSVIYLALLVFIVYQLWLAFWGEYPQELERLMTRMKHWWLVSCLAHASWFFAWHYEMLPLSLLLMLLLLVSLAAIHQNFAIGHADAPRREKLFMHIPFSLYLGWISFTTLGNLTALMVYWGWQGQGISPIAWAVLMISLGAGLSVYMILQHHNITYGLANAWAFAGIILKRKSMDMITGSVVAQACIIAIGMIAVAVSWRWYRQKGF